MPEFHGSDRRTLLESHRFGQADDGKAADIVNSPLGVEWRPPLLTTLSVASAGSGHSATSCR